MYGFTNRFQIMCNHRDQKLNKTLEPLCNAQQWQIYLSQHSVPNPTHPVSLVPIPDLMPLPSLLLPNPSPAEGFAVAHTIPIKLEHYITHKTTATHKNASPSGMTKVSGACSSSTGITSIGSSLPLPFVFVTGSSSGISIISGSGDGAFAEPSIDSI